MCVRMETFLATSMVIECSKFNVDNFWCLNFDEIQDKLYMCFDSRASLLDKLKLMKF